MIDGTELTLSLDIGFFRVKRESFHKCNLGEPLKQSAEPQSAKPTPSLARFSSSGSYAILFSSAEELLNEAIKYSCSESRGVEKGICN